MSRRTRRRRDSRLQRLRKRVEDLFRCCLQPATEEPEEEVYGATVAPPCPARVDSDAQSKKTTDTAAVGRMDTEAGDSDRGTATPLPDASPSPSRKDTRREMSFSDDFYIRLHANNLVTASIYWAKEHLFWAGFEESHYIAGDPSSDLTRITTTAGEATEETESVSSFSMMSGLTGLSFISSIGGTLIDDVTLSLSETASCESSVVSYFSSMSGRTELSSTSESSEGSSIGRFATASETGTNKVEEEEQERDEELGGVEFFITLHTRNIVDSAIIRGILEVEMDY